MGINTGLDTSMRMGNTNLSSWIYMKRAAEKIDLHGTSATHSSGRNNDSSQNIAHNIVIPQMQNNSTFNKKQVYKLEKIYESSLHRFANVNVNKVTKCYGVVLILLASCSFRCILSLYKYKIYIN